jgi:hypothetical protein
MTESISEATWKNIDEQYHMKKVNETSLIFVFQLSL